MIKLTLTKDEEIKLEFEGENFTEILNACKSVHLSYIKEERAWTGDNCSIYNVISRLKEIEDFDVSNEIIELIKPKPQVKFIRRIFNRSLLKAQPIAGKSPNENYQIEDSKRVLNSNRMIVNWDTGLGKTYLAAVVLSNLHSLKEIDSVLFLVPNHLKINWKRELKKFYYQDLTDDDFYVTSIFNRNPFESGKKYIIASYSNLVMISDDFYKKTKKKVSKKYRKTCLPIDAWFKNRAIILDECFTYDTLVDTDLGLLKIGDIVENRIECKAFSYDIENKILEYNSILNFKKSLIKNNLLKITFNNNSIITCTQTHKIWSVSRNSYIKANDLYLGEIVYGKENLYNMQQGINKISKKMLFLQMFWNLEKESKRYNIYKRKKSKGEGRNSFVSRDREISVDKENEIRKNENKQPWFRPAYHRKMEKNKRRKRDTSCLVWNQRRKRELYGSTTSFEKFSRKRMEIRTGNMHKKSNSIRRVRELSKFLQNRHRKFTIENSHRNRWNLSSFLRKEDKRFKKGILLNSIGVENIKVLESRDRLESTKCSSENYVYNIEIEKNHNYFANSILVSNCQNIKNNSRQTQIALQIKDYFEFRYLLSATIAPNSFADLYYQFQFLDESILYCDYYTFLEKIAYLGTRFSKYDIQIDRETKEKRYKWDEIEKLKNELSKYIIIRKKEDCLELPENTIIKNYSELFGENLEIYRNIISYYLNIIKEEKGYIESKEVKNKIPYILQALNNINMLKEKIDPDKNLQLYNQINKWEFKDHSKLEVLNALLEKYINDENRKVIIFSDHPKTIEDLKDYYSKKYKSVILHGEIVFKNKEEEREALVNSFKFDKSIDLLIANPFIIKTGLNITECNRIIYFDRNYNYETYYQSKDRIYRIGQEKKTIINNLILENTLDEAIDKSLESKQSINDILNSKETRTAQEWRDIFEGRV